MVGHTGIKAAAIKAVETVDACLSKVVPAILEKGGVVIVTADHGNAELMEDPETERRIPLIQHLMFLSYWRDIKKNAYWAGEIWGFSPTYWKCSDRRSPGDDRQVFDY